MLLSLHYTLTIYSFRAGSRADAVWSSSRTCKWVPEVLRDVILSIECTAPEPGELNFPFSNKFRIQETQQLKS